jgi:hypothetical protein
VFPPTNQAEWVAGLPRNARPYPCPIACDTPLDGSLDTGLCRSLVAGSGTRVAADPTASVRRLRLICPNDYTRLTRQMPQPKKTSTERAVRAKRETRALDFKEHFDPNSAAHWTELVKDFMAIANSS